MDPLTEGLPVLQRLDAVNITVSIHSIEQERLDLLADLSPECQ
jgi:hypothetical protein